MRIFFNLIILAIFTACFASPAPAGVFYDDGATTMHFAFEGSPNGDRPVVRPPAFYHADDGFGFVDSPLLTGNRLGVRAPKYFRFDVNLPDGNYDVAVTLGNPDYNSITTVKSEGHHAMVLDDKVPAGGSDVKIFTVNVQHGKLGDNEPLDSDGRLNLEFVGVNPSMMKLDIQPNPTAITVYLAGDSTVGDHEDTPLAGWGQMLPLFFKPEEVAVSNHAASASGDPANDQRLADIDKTIKAGDWLLVQFGADETNRIIHGSAQLKAMLKAYVGMARKHQAKCALITPPPMSGRVVAGGAAGGDDDSSVAQLTSELGRAENIPVIDLRASAQAFFGQLLPDGKAKAFDNETPAPLVAIHYQHLKPYGAFEIAKLVAQGIKDQKLDLATHLTSNLTTNPDPAKFPAHLGYDFLLNTK